MMSRLFYKNLSQGFKHQYPKAKEGSTEKGLCIVSRITEKSYTRNIVKVHRGKRLFGQQYFPESRVFTTPRSSFDGVSSSSKNQMKIYKTSGSNLRGG